MSTAFLSLFFGIFFVVMGLGFLFHRKHSTEAIASVASHPGAQLVAGAIPLLLGIWVVLVHDIWVAGWPVVVTIVGWLLLLHGVYRLWCPNLWAAQLEKHKASGSLIYGIIWLVVGILLLLSVYH